MNANETPIIIKPLTVKEVEYPKETKLYLILYQLSEHSEWWALCEGPCKTETEACAKIQEVGKGWHAARIIEVEVPR